MTCRFAAGKNTCWFYFKEFTNWGWKCRSQFYVTDWFLSQFSSTKTNFWTPRPVHRIEVPAPPTPTTKVTLTSMSWQSGTTAPSNSLSWPTQWDPKDPRMGPKCSNLSQPFLTNSSGALTLWSQWPHHHSPWVFQNTWGWTNRVASFNHGWQFQWVQPRCRFQPIGSGRAFQ